MSIAKFSRNGRLISKGAAYLLSSRVSQAQSPEAVPETFNTRFPVTQNKMSQKIDVLLYGLGAIGSFYAYILQKSDQVRLSVAARSNYDAVKANGLTIKSDNHGEHSFRPAAVLRSSAEAGHTFDLVVCCNKATNPEGTPMQIASAVEDGKTVIALMQNGVGNEDPFHEAFPKSTILSGVVGISRKGTQIES